MHQRILIALLILFASCAKDRVDPNSTLWIKSGTRYGFCAGYCEQSVTLTPSTTTLERKATRMDTLPDLECVLPADASIWREASGLVDERFFALDSVYGCPDCHDQGAEYIEVVTNSRSHLITFDPDIEIAIHPLVDLLRSIRMDVLQQDSCN